MYVILDDKALRLFNHIMKSLKDQDTAKIICNYTFIQRKKKILIKIYKNTFAILISEYFID